MTTSSNPFEAGHQSAPLPKPILWGRGSSTNVQKVLWALHELNIDHDWIEVAGPFGGTDTPEFATLNPNRTVPVWQTNDIVLWESQAILRHLARSHGRLYGSDESTMAEVDRWLDWFALVFWPPVRLLFLDVYRDKKVSLKAPSAQAALTKTQSALLLIDDHLMRNGSLAQDDFTLADIALAIGLNRMRGLDYGLTMPGHLCEWHATLKARPGFNSATVHEPNMPGHARAAA